MFRLLSGTKRQREGRGDEIERNNMYRAVKENELNIHMRADIKQGIRVGSLVLPCFYTTASGRSIIGRKKAERECGENLVLLPYMSACLPSAVPPSICIGSLHYQSYPCVVLTISN